MMVLGATVGLLLLNAGVVSAAPPDNDRIEHGTVIPAIPFRGTADTTKATRSGTDPSCTGDTHTVWYRYRATASERLYAGVVADFDATISVYTRSGRGLSMVACGDDPPEVVFRASAGTTYHVMVASCCGRSGGPTTLFVQRGSQAKVVVRNPSASVETRTGDVQVHGTIRCARTTGVSISVHVRQRTSDGVIAVGNGGASFVECDGTAHPWSALVLTERAFEPGWARIIVNATGCNVFGCSRAELSEVVEIS
jgi:hypothetical protein